MEIGIVIVPTIIYLLRLRFLLACLKKKPFNYGQHVPSVTLQSAMKKSSVVMDEKDYCCQIFMIMKGVFKTVPPS